MTKEKMQILACGRNFGNELQNDVIIYSCSVTSCDLIYFEGTIYTYNNYGNKEWLIHGITKGYA